MNWAAFALGQAIGSVLFVGFVFWWNGRRDDHV